MRNQRVQYCDFFHFAGYPSHTASIFVRYRLHTDKSQDSISNRYFLYIKAYMTNTTTYLLTTMVHLDADRMERINHHFFDTSMSTILCLLLFCLFFSHSTSFLIGYRMALSTLRHTYRMSWWFSFNTEKYQDSLFHQLAYTTNSTTYSLRCTMIPRDVLSNRRDINEYSTLTAFIFLSSDHYPFHVQASIFNLLINYNLLLC